MTRFAAGIILLAAVSVISCTGAGSADSDRIDTMRLTGTVIAGDDAFKSPYGIVASASRVYVRNSGTAAMLIDEYDTNGQYVRSFLPQGSGEGAMPYLDAIRYDEANSRLIVEAAPMYGALRVVDNLDSEKPRLKTVFTLPKRIVGSPADSIVPANIIRLVNGAIITPNLTPAGMLAIYDNYGKFKKIIQPYPPKEELGSDVPDYALANFFQMKGAASPDGKHFAAASLLGDIISFGTVEGDSVKITTNVGEPQEGIEISSEDGNFATFSYTDKLRYFFPGGVTVSNSSVYTIEGGYANDFTDTRKKMTEGEAAPATRVRVYDYNGKIKRVLELNVGRCLITVSPDDSVLYALSEDNENGYQLFKFEL
ncbi:MAG: TolB-like 6-bladed beta-propeller domain-containing protein [Paramuribaculum sp.]|nr:TolB-like 6-bladed beta-propeller domain-containing protein [Paramuribaculum sp.]